MTAPGQVDYDERTHARVGNPETSGDAAEEAAPLAGEHSRLILNVIGYAAGEPLAVEETERRSSLTKWQILRRMSDLRAAGKIADSGEKYTNANGRKAIRWALAPPVFALTGE